MNIKLSKRMKLIADMVTPGKCVADIGCDHGYVSIYLVEQKKSEHVIAMDVAKGPLEIAKKNIMSSGLSGKIDVRLSDGFDALEAGESDEVIIAGMGGNLIIDILKRGLHKMSAGYELVLSPQSDVPLVRSFLREKGFVIKDEEMLVEDGKYYNIIKAELSEMGVNTETENKENDSAEDKQLILNDTYGGKLIEKKHPVLKDYLEKQMEKYQGIFCRLSKSSGEGAVKRLSEISSELSDMEAVMKQL